MPPRTTETLRARIAVLLCLLALVSTPAAALAVTPTTPAATTGGGVAADARNSAVSFDLRLVDYERCGVTCAVATGTVTNTGDRDAHAVVTTVTVFAGQTPVWTDTQPLGTMRAGETRTLTETVRLSFVDVLRLQSAQHVTVRVTVATAEGTYVEDHVIDR